MFYKRLLSAYWIFSWGLLILSCSTDDICNNYSINLDLLKNNNWEKSRAIFNLLNAHRDANEINLLTQDTLYAAAYAIKHNYYMLTHGVVNHDNFFKRNQGLKERGANNVSEIIAFGYSSPQSALNGWIHSESHRLTLENDYTHAGVAVIESEDGNEYITVLFYN